MVAGLYRQVHNEHLYCRHASMLRLVKISPMPVSLFESYQHSLTSRRLRDAVCDIA
jgi:hypothetical protein